MKITLKLPRLSMNMDEGTVIAWLKQPGESFKAGDPLYSVETEKVITEVDAPCDGTLLEILVPPETNVEVGANVCRIERSA
jgi:pyruvate/2-oxoglutarate dehydrogenase complex dihydrolipoamide acyltransferase (E2) component